MDYPEALAYLASLGKFGIQLGLKRIEALLEVLDHPERRFRSIHVTGTNGKGSTTAFIARILLQAGIRSGMYISPHLIDYPERMTLNGTEISREEFAAVIGEVAVAAEKVRQKEMDGPTEFEVLTAAAFLWFARSQAEYVVVEVGLGGLLDSTNVIIPEVSVITNVSLEHTDRCGSTVAEIAHHKAGIVKEGIPVVTAAEAEALAVIEQTAKIMEAPCFVLGRDFRIDGFRYQGLQQHFVLKSSSGRERVYESGMLGRHQAANASLAICAADCLAARDSRITEQSITEGIAATFWPARFEVMAERPTVILDGAHNPAGVAVLRQTLDEVLPERDIVFVFGVLADKDYSRMIEALFRPNEQVIVVRPESDRAAAADRIAGEIEGRVATVEVADSVERGMALAIDRAGPRGVVCAAGSLYMIGTARQVARKLLSFEE